MKKQIVVLGAFAMGFANAFAAAPAFDTLISHRGESIDAPENTFPACAMAVERGFGFECDIYLSKDGRVFTFHDRNLSRTTGGANTNLCCDVTWEELSKLDVGNWGKWCNSNFKGTRPALLEEILTLARDGRRIYIEVKPGPEIVPFIKDVFAKQKKANPENVLFISFNEESCRELKKQMPQYKVYWLTSPWHHIPQGGRKSRSAQEIVATLKDVGADGVDCCYDTNSVTADYIKTVRDAGFEFHVWTLDNLALTIEAFYRGAQTVTTNCAKQQLDYWRLAEKMIEKQQNTPR